MSLLDIDAGSGGLNVDVNGDAFRTTARNPVASLFLEADSKLAYILAIVAGALFAVGALLALVNFLRDRFGVHLLLLLFSLERVATYVIRAIIWHNDRRIYFEVYEIMETAGFALLIVILWHIWGATGRLRSDGSRGGGGIACHCCFLLIATFFTACGCAAFIAGVVLQDRASSTQDQFERGYKLRKAAVVDYGGVIAVFLVFCIFLLCRRHGRAFAPLLFICGCLLAAKAGFEIYAVWHNPSRYYKNAFWWPLGVLTELLVLLILVLPGVLRKALGRTKPALPVTDDGQYVVGNAPHAPVYQSGPAIAPLHGK